MLNLIARDIKSCGLEWIYCCLTSDPENSLSVDCCVKNNETHYAKSANCVVNYCRVELYVCYRRFLWNGICLIIEPGKMAVAREKIIALAVALWILHTGCFVKTSHCSLSINFKHHSWCNFQGALVNCSSTNVDYIYFCHFEPTIHFFHYTKSTRKSDSLSDGEVAAL